MLKQRQSGREGSGGDAEIGVIGLHNKVETPKRVDCQRAI
jgi:hypothetical protein